MGLFRPLLNRAFSRVYPVYEDKYPPDIRRMARYMDRYGLIPSRHANDTQSLLNAVSPQIEAPAADAVVSTATSPLRLPAQWEPMESVLLSWPVLYPPLWPLYAQMVAAILPVCEVVISVPARTWSHAAAAYLAAQASLSWEALAQVRYVLIPTDDIWIRDYGPLVGYDADGLRAVVNPRFDPLPMYPAQQDDAFAARYAGWRRWPLHNLPLYTEGGNLWSDGEGTLLMTDQIFYSNPYLTRDRLEAQLQQAVNYDRLIITPRMRVEQTGHIDLLAKLADARTVLIAAPTEPISGERLRSAANLFQRETNARGERYQVVTLPTPPLYFNWWYPIRRSYTNALTINGRVLVPTYQLPQDELALATYEAAMPGHTVIPIDCTVGVLGGGAVHCLTKEIPARRENPN